MLADIDEFVFDFIKSISQAINPTEYILKTIG